jgi:predicted metalloprotease with PDZ domain
MKSFAIGAAYLVVLFLAPAAGTAESRYAIDLAESKSSILRVSLDTACASLPCDFQLPAWSATYQLRNFAQYVGPVRAETADGEQVELRKTGPSRWRIASAPQQAIRLTYDVRADRDGPFGSQARSDRVTVNLPQILLYAEAERDKPAYLKFENVPKGFREALALPHWGGYYEAVSYDRLVDTPVLLADFKEDAFQVGGKSIRVVAYGPGAGRRMGALRGTARKVVKTAMDLMGEDSSFEGYTFVYVFAHAAGGGMEYRDGTLIFGPADCPTCRMDELTAHEFFHRWNVKRIRAASMEPVDYSRPVLSPSLWFAEGVSSTYARFLLAAAGITTERDMLSRLEERINQYESRPARLTQSAEESSIDAWLEGDPSYHRPDRSVSYYLKGELIGYLLDLEIRGRTENRRSLDDVLRRLDQDYAQQGRLFDDTRGLIEIASDVADSDMTAVFDELVRTASPIDWDHYLGRAGLHLERISRTWRDSGMSLASPPGEGIMVSMITPAGTAEKAGIQVGDRLVEIDGQRVIGSSEAVLGQLRDEDNPGSVTVDREGAKLTLPLRSIEKLETVHRVVSLARITAAQQLVRDGWLNRQTSKGATP